MTRSFFNNQIEPKLLYDSSTQTPLLIACYFTFNSF